MLIVCPSCATSYMIDPAAVGTRGRTVRCARCKSLWFTAPPPLKVDETVATFVDDVIAEAQARPSPSPPSRPPVREDVVEGPVSRPAAASGPAPGLTADEAAAFRAALTEPAPETAAMADPAPDDARPAAEAEHPLTEAPPLVPPSEPVGEAAAAASPAIEDVEDFAARRLRRRNKRKAKSKPWLPYVILTLVAINAALIAWRTDVVRMVPQTASFYAAIGLPVNLRGLEFRNVKIGTEDDGMNVLVVEGDIVCTSRRAVEVPRLRFSVRNAAGHEIYSWTAQAARSVLGPGESLAFRSRLSSPPDDAHDVLVRFLSTRDMSGGS